MDEWLSIVVFCAVAWLILVIVTVFSRRLIGSTVDNHCLTVRDNARGHHWMTVDAFDAGSYCSVCEVSTFSGARCDFCDILVDSGCLRKADKCIACKMLTVDDKIFKHQWMHGNLPTGSVCSVCEEPCGDGPGLQDWRCCWCQLYVHTKCKASIGLLCDFGKLKRMIVPPNCIRGQSSGWKGRKLFIVKEVLKPNVSDWSPVIIIGNRGSGNGESYTVLEAFRKVLNPAQVIDLAEQKPSTAIEWCRMVEDTQCRILVAGGDGTVTWVLSTIDSLNLSKPPSIAILPLGTGNDLSRVLGYGSGHNGHIDPVNILLSLDRAKQVSLDRWNVIVTPPKVRRRFQVSSFRTKHLQMTNYFSIGVDALVTFNFHQRRRTIPRVISSRVLNKFLFFSYGTKDVYERACSGLKERIKLKLDGKLINLPNIEGLVFLNIPCWGAGVRPLEMGNTTHEPQRIDDKRIEVFALYSSFHIAQLQVGISEPHRLGQAREMELELCSGKIPMQVDGEPWLQGPCKVVISHRAQMPVLAAHPLDPVLQSPAIATPPVKFISFF